MPASTTLPRCSGAARWQQRSASTAALPLASRNSTTGSLQMRRASGAAPISSAQAAMYQALRSSIESSLLISRQVGQDVDDKRRRAAGEGLAGCLALQQLQRQDDAPLADLPPVPPADPAP